MSDVLACACGTCPDCAPGSGGAPGPLDALRWRHGVVRERLLERIGRISIEETLPLAALTTRTRDDPAIALVDAFAGSLHILAWNAARLADDATLARGEDRQALADLVALTGYQPRPALSATTLLAYTLDAFPGAPAEVTIPAGNRVASLPNPGELPVSFETDAELVARPEWNTLLPVVPQIVTQPAKTDTAIDLAGTSFAGKVGDMVAAKLDMPDSGKDWFVAQITAIAVLDKMDPPRVRVSVGGIKTNGPVAAAASDKKVLILLGKRTVAFGATSPDPLLLLKPTAAGADPVKDQIDQPQGQLPEWKLLLLTTPGTGGDTVDLDGSVAEAVAGRLMVIQASVGQRVVKIVSASETARRGYGMSGKVTRTTFTGLTFQTYLSNPVTSIDTQVRGTSFLVETARYPLLSTPDPDAILPDAAKPAELVVEGKVTVPVGRMLLLTGLAKDPDTTQWNDASETALVKSVAVESADPPRTRIVFAADLASRFRTTSVALWGNVVGASHGESAPTTTPELLGSSDATVLNPRFKLMRKPLTELPADGPQGYAPALEVRVDGRRYDLLPNLYDVPASAHGYRVETDGDGRSFVRFAGRLPTAANSVTATYRAGAGAMGNLDPGKIVTALAPVPGVRAVVNPVPSDGGSDAEGIDAMRDAAPRQLGTFDRVVSLADFEAFASGYRGVGKALASELWLGMRRIVVLTVASTSLHQPSQELIDRLGKAIRALAPPGRRLRLQGFTPMTPVVKIAYAADPALRREDVETAIRAELGKRFGTANRRFAEGLARSAVIAAVQGVSGVTGVMLTQFGLPNGQPLDNGRLLVPGPSASIGGAGVVTFALAGLLSIDPVTVQFEELAP
ncbi:baseplate J/gp47 family protein [Sphingomonas sp.]|uniref:baseplate J/gp47 family protein n=1 Tax=Sphingomonas sp. TaxID=28214 RepID=UPI001B2C37B3|nr:baseplate J/gp47 family protein [Sphingomonas sp.]MBO9713894.1 baseplate J/gp47 family protein [Sphingomonas sp.]